MKKGVLLLFLATFSVLLFAQDLSVVDIGQVAVDVEAKKAAGQHFTMVDLVSSTQAMVEQETEAIILDLDRSVLDQVSDAQLENIELALPIKGEMKNISLVAANIFAAGFDVHDENGDVLVDQERGTHYRGMVSNDQSSLVSISIYENKITGFVRTEGEFYLIRQFETEQGLACVMFSPELDQEEGFSCTTPDDGYVYTEEELASNLQLRAGGAVGIYLEVDNDIYKNKGQGTSGFATGIFNESATLYQNDGVTIQLSDLVIWTGRGPYKGNSASQLLSSFQNHHGSSGTWNGDLAHLIAYRGSGGIAAGFNGLCNGDRRQSMCFSGVDASYAPVPAYSWTVMVFTHEMGHLLGSRHTHACVWNGNGTAIDGCYNVEGGCPRPGLPENGGTIMSYCHLTAVGINFNNGFGPQPQAVIQNSIAAAGCLGGGVGGNHCTNGVQDADEEGVDCGGADCAPCPTGSCDDPTGLYANNIKGNRAKLNWDAVAGALSYDVQVRDENGVYTASNTFNTSGNSLSLRGFSVGATYKWHVKANCSGSSSNYSVECTFVSGDANSGACGTTLERGNTDYTVYPNPAYDQITIYGGPADEVTDAVFFDLSGKMIYSSQFEGSNTLDISGFEQGLYFIKLSSTTQTQTVKVQIR